MIRQPAASSPCFHLARRAMAAATASLLLTLVGCQPAEPPTPAADGPAVARSRTSKPSQSPSSQQLTSQNDPSRPSPTLDRPAPKDPPRPDPSQNGLPQRDPYKTEPPSGPVRPAEPDSTPLPPVEQPQPPPAPLPDYPKLHPDNTLTPLNPEKTIFAEVATVDGKKKVVRVGLVCEVCLREGPLEVLLCRKGTKEHEGILRIDADAKFIHAALEAAGAKPGKPTQFINPQTEQPEYKPATGQPVRVLVHYRRDGQTHTHPAQEWVWDRERKQPLPHGWVFAGSVTIVDPETKREFYGANSGDIISISNFPYSMLELPVEISKDDADLVYEARTSHIPPLWSKVWLILEPLPDTPSP